MYIVKQVEETIKKYSMISLNENVLIGLSGGADSVCLSLILKKLSSQYSLTLSAVYIDHGLRPEDIDREIAFCKSFASSIDITFNVRHVRVSSDPQIRKSQNLHDELRYLRYSEYRKLAFELGAASIALGHTMDDQAETLLMRLLRGTGLRGMGGIYPVNCGIIRPLLEVSRHEIEGFLKEQRQELINDPSNQKDIYLRNRIRHSVIPILKQLNPNLSETLTRTSDSNRDDEDLLELITTIELENLFFSKTSDTVELYLAPFMQLHRAMKRRVIRRCVEAIAGLRGINLNHIDAVITLLEEGNMGGVIHLPDSVRAVKEYKTFKITTVLPQKLSLYHFDVPGNLYLKESGLTLEASIEQGNIKLEKRPNEAVFDLNRIKSPLYVRSRQPGDFFFPSGFGKRKKLQDFFVDLKIPREARDSIPIVTSGNDIIWVAGYRPDERYSVSNDTQRCLVLKILNH